MQEGLSMEKELLNLASELFAKVGATEECRRVIDNYEHVYQFDLDGKPAFYVELNRGVITVKSGAHDKGEYGKTSLRISMIMTDKNTMRAILKGKLRALDASKQGLWTMHVVSWSDQLLYTLLRIGRDIVMEEFMAAQN
jgi:hypothetical protein